MQARSSARVFPASVGFEKKRKGTIQHAMSDVESTLAGGSKLELPLQPPPRMYVYECGASFFVAPHANSTGF